MIWTLDIIVDFDVIRYRQLSDWRIDNEVKEQTRNNVSKSKAL